MYFLLKMVIFHGYVSLPEGSHNSKISTVHIYIFKYVYIHITSNLAPSFFSPPIEDRSLLKHTGGEWNHFAMLTLEGLLKHQPPMVRGDKLS